MISPEVELDRLRSPAPAGEAPPGMSLDVVAGRCPGGAAPALDRCRELMEVVLAHQTGSWPDLDEWLAILPLWFTRACVDDRHIQTCAVTVWSVRAWLHWLRPENRRWYWWGAEASGDTLEVRVAVVSRPYLRGALEWALTCAGAGLAREAS